MRVCVSFWVGPEALLLGGSSLSEAAKAFFAAAAFSVSQVLLEAYSGTPVPWKEGAFSPEAGSFLQAHGNIPAVPYLRHNGGIYRLTGIIRVHSYRIAKAVPPFCIFQSEVGSSSRRKPK
jgi:hypothetical protein